MSFIRHKIAAGQFERFEQTDDRLPTVQIKTYRQHETERGIMLEDTKVLSTVYIPQIGASVEGYDFGVFHKVREVRYTYSEGRPPSITIICEFPKDNSLNC